MNKRVIAAVSAGVLALLGVLVLVMWAQKANDRAFEGAELVSVVRLTDSVGVGTSAADLAGKTEVVKLPDEAVPDGAVTNLAEVKGLSTNASVQKGELLLESRMAAPGSDKSKSNGQVPTGMQEITMALDAEHTVGGVLKAGDKVGILFTFDQNGGTEPFAKSRIDQVLVTRLGGGTGVEDIKTQLVTVAVSSADAEKIAFGRDMGKVWLTLQNGDTTGADSAPTTIKEIK